MFAQRRKHLAGDANHVLHVGTDQAENGHVGEDAHVATLLQALLGAGKGLDAGAGRVDGQRDVDLGRGDEVDRDAVLVENGKDARKEAVRDGALVGVHVDDANVVLDGDGRGPLRRLGLAVGVGGEMGQRPRVVQLVRGGQDGVGDDDGAGAARVLDVFDADRDRGRGADDLVHGEMVNDLGAVEGQLGSLRRRDGCEEARRRHLGRVSGEDAVDFLPDLQLLGLEADGAESSAQVSVAAADIAINQTAWHITKEASDDRHLVSACAELLVEGFHCRLVKAGIEGVRGPKVQHITEVHVICIDTLSPC